MVIQRWQSVLLLCVAVIMGCFSFSSLGQFQTPVMSLDFTPLGFIIEGEPSDASVPTGYLLYTWYFFTVSVMSAIIPFIAIFSYKNLRLQKRLCLIDLMFVIASLAVMYSLAYTDTAVSDATIGWGWISWTPYAAIFGIIWAYRCIASDEKKIRSANRLRD